MDSTQPSDGKVRMVATTAVSEQITGRSGNTLGAERAETREKSITTGTAYRL